MCSMHVLVVALLSVSIVCLNLLNSPIFTQAAASNEGAPVVPQNCPLELSVEEHSRAGTLLANLPERLGLAALAAATPLSPAAGSDSASGPITLRLTSPTQSLLVRYESWSSAASATAGAGAGDLLMAHSVDRETLCDEGVDGLSAGDRRALECCTPDGRPRADHCRLALEFEISLPPRTFTTCRVTLNILDKNDHSPAFRPPTLALSVDESAPVGTQLPLETRADDPDKGANAALTYSQEGQWGPFALVSPSTSATLSGVSSSAASAASSTGSGLALRVERALNYEEAKGYELRVRACDAGAPPLCGTLNVSVSVRDVNEFTPIFMDPPPPQADLSEPSTAQTLHVAESLRVGSVVQRVRAVDGDGGEFGRVSYAIGRPGLTTHRPFRIDERTGDLILEQPLNAYHQRTYELRVIALDAGQPPRQAVLPLRLVVQDENDHRPELLLVDMEGREQRASTDDGGIVRLAVRENSRPSTPLAYLSAVDEDLGLRGVVQCRLERGHEMVRLELMSGGPSQNLKDDQQPERTRYLLMTSNATIDYELQRMLAIDVLCEDRGDEVRQSVRLAPRPLDGSFVRGNGDASGTRAATSLVKQESRLEVELEVLPENEFPPKFLAREYAFDVRENSSYPSAIGALAAADNDSGDEMHFFIEKSASPGGGEQFFLREHLTNEHEWAVELHLNGTVDREVDLSNPAAERTFRFRVFATDLSQDDRSASARKSEHTVWTQVVVRVMDVNDWTPRYDGENMFRVAEGRNRGLVGELRAFDPDVGNFGQVTFELTDPTAKFALAPYAPLDSTTPTSSGSSSNEAAKQSAQRVLVLPVHNSERGVSRANLVLRAELDREGLGDRVLLGLRVRDGGSLWSTATLTVSILDLNDNAPVWNAPPPTCSADSTWSSSSGAGSGVGCVSASSPSRVPTIALNVSSETAPGSVLYRLNATDRDAGLNSQVHYSIVSSQGAAEFVVLDCQSGELLLHRTLQRESLGKRYEVEVEARDSAQNAALQSARAMVIVHTYIGARGILPLIAERDRSEAIRNKCGAHMEAEREAGGVWAAVRSLAESPSFNLVLTITMLVLTAMLASFLLLCIVAMRRRMRHADADGSGNAHHSKRARRKYAAKNGANGRAHTSFSSSQSHSLVGGGAAVGDAAELEAFSPGATGGLLTVVGVQGLEGSSGLASPSLNCTYGDGALAAEQALLAGTITMPRMPSKASLRSGQNAGVSVWPASGTLPLMHQSYRDAGLVAGTPMPDGTFVKYGTLTSQCGSVYRTLNRFDTRFQNLLPFNEELMNGDPNADGAVLQVLNGQLPLQTQRSHESVRNGDQQPAGDPNGQTPDTNENRSSDSNNSAGRRGSVHSFEHQSLVAAVPTGSGTLSRGGPKRNNYENGEFYVAQVPLGFEPIASRPLQSFGVGQNNLETHTSYAQRPVRCASALANPIAASFSFSPQLQHQQTQQQTLTPRLQRYNGGYLVPGPYLTAVQLQNNTFLPTLHLQPTQYAAAPFLDPQLTLPPEAQLRLASPDSGQQLTYGQFSTVNGGGQILRPASALAFPLVTATNFPAVDGLSPVEDVDETAGDAAGDLWTRSGSSGPGAGVSTFLQQQRRPSTGSGSASASIADSFTTVLRRPVPSVSTNPTSTAFADPISSLPKDSTSPPPLISLPNPMPTASPYGPIRPLISLNSPTPSSSATASPAASGGLAPTNDTLNLFAGSGLLPPGTEIGQMPNAGYFTGTPALAPLIPAASFQNALFAMQGAGVPAGPAAGRHHLATMSPLREIETDDV